MVDMITSAPHLSSLHAAMVIACTAMVSTSHKDKKKTQEVKEEFARRSCSWQRVGTCALPSAISQTALTNYSLAGQYIAAVFVCMSPVLRGGCRTPSNSMAARSVAVSDGATLGTSQHRRSTERKGRPETLQRVIWVIWVCSITRRPPTRMGRRM